jgi:hypothetical protein
MCRTRVFIVDEIGKSFGKPKRNLTALVQAVNLPIIILLLSLLALPGRARTAVREATLAQGEARNAIRTLGLDQRFSTLSSQSLTRRLLAEHTGRPVNILTLSGGGVDGAFGTSAPVGLTRSSFVIAPSIFCCRRLKRRRADRSLRFLGSHRDDQFAEVYTSDHAEHMNCHPTTSGSSHLLEGVFLGVSSRR